MKLVNEQEMIELLGCTREAFIGYLDAQVFAPAINRKRGRPTTKAAGSALYESETVLHEVKEFLSGKFTPHTTVGPTSESGEKSTGQRTERHVRDSGDNCGVSEKDAGKVIHINGKIPDADEPDFDFEKEIGDISTYKLLKAAVIKCTGRMNVPLKVKKDLHKTFELLSKDREKKDARKKKVTVEKYQADLQKVHESWSRAWESETGELAAKEICEQFESITGKQLRREISNAVSIIHRQIVRVSNAIVQPKVLAEIEKL